MGRVRLALLYLVIAVLTVGAGQQIAKIIDPRVTAEQTRSSRETAARDAGRDFLKNYVEADGRVVRRDEGGDVVSEGQAYGMLIAVALDDQARFRSIWQWTKSHLRRPDGLLSWRWVDGNVTDANSAADADLDAARALLLAGRQFHVPDLYADGEHLGAQSLQFETVPLGTATAPPSDVAPPGKWVTGSGRVIVAGNWATSAPSALNAGYFNPRANQELFEESADQQWQDISRTEQILGWQLAGNGLLPPDWALVNQAGYAMPSGPPAGGQPASGLDAARLPIRFAESCNPDDRSVAASMRTAFGASKNVPAIRNLDGSALVDWQHPVTLVAAAATDHAAGDDDAAATRLDEAAALQQKYPTYYGAAWVALGRIMLATTLLGQCPPAQ
jgi:endoglucanase